LLDQPRFRAGFDFMRLRADTGAVDEALVDWWQEFSTGDADIQQDLVEQLRQELAKRPRAPRVQRAPPPAGEAVPQRTLRQTTDAGDAKDGAFGVALGGDAPKKRRRRRRTSGNGGTGEGSTGGVPPAT